MDNKTYLNSKKWVDPKTTGLIYTNVSRTNGDYYATLKLADCSRIVQFDTYIHLQAERKKTLKKVQILIDEMTKFRDAILNLPDGGN